MPQEATEGILKGRTMDIGIGTRLSFELGIKGQEFKAGGVLVGMVPHEYVIIGVPAIPGILGRLAEGSPIVVRYIYAGNVFGFASTILTCIQKPALMVFLMYPSAVEAMNLCKAERTACFFPATVKTDYGAYNAAIIDISLVGCRVRIDYGAGKPLSLDTDQTVTLSFHLTGRAEEQVINATVRNFKKGSQFSEMGVLFDQENEAVLSNVKLYIECLVKFQCLSSVEML